jgi:hypothetical protein
MKDFRGIADELMQDIHAGHELKEKTLQRLEHKKHIPLTRVLVPAACILLAVGIMSLRAPQTPSPIDDQNPEMNIMMGQPEDAQALPGSELSMMTGERKIESLEAARDDFGDGFLVPLRLPEGFRLESIHAYGEKGEATQIILTYAFEEKSFLVIEERTDARQQVENSRKVDLQGETGYLNPGITRDQQPDPVINELHWYVNNVHYSVGGFISEQEAVEIALSMK